MKKYTETLEQTVFPYTPNCDVGEIVKNFSLSINQKINESVKAAIMDCLVGIYFQDYNRECEYSKMSGAEVVEKLHKTLEGIEKRFNISKYDIDEAIGYSPSVPWEE